MQRRRSPHLKLHELRFTAVARCAARVFLESSECASRATAAMLFDYYEEVFTPDAASLLQDYALINQSSMTRKLSALTACTQLGQIMNRAVENTERFLARELIELLMEHHARTGLYHIELSATGAK